AGPVGRPLDQHAAQGQVDQRRTPHRGRREQPDRSLDGKAMKAAAFVPQRVHVLVPERSFPHGQRAGPSTSSSTNLLPKNASSNSSIATSTSWTARRPRQPNRSRPNSSAPNTIHASSDSTV